MGQVSLQQLSELVAQAPQNLRSLLARIAEGVSPTMRSVRAHVAHYAESVEKFETTASPHGIITGTYRPPSPLLVIHEPGSPIDWVVQAVQTRNPDKETFFFLAADASAVRRTLPHEDTEPSDHSAVLTEMDLRFLNQGILVLPQLSRLSLADQELLNSCLQGGVIHRRDKKKRRMWPPDVIVIAAQTAQGFAEMDRNNRVLEDLLRKFRIFPPAVIPPLRERPEEILFLVQEMLIHRGSKLGLNELRIQTNFSEEALLLLINHPWPRNEDELFCVVEHLLFTRLWQRPSYVVGREEVEVALDVQAAGWLPSDAEFSPPADHRERTAWHWDTSFPEGDLDAAVGRLRRGAVVEALRQTDGKKRPAARLLGIERHTLDRILEGA